MGCGCPRPLVGPVKVAFKLTRFALTLCRGRLTRISLLCLDALSSLYTGGAYLVDPLPFRGLSLLWVGGGQDGVLDTAWRASFVIISGLLGYAPDALTRTTHVLLWEMHVPTARRALVDARGSTQMESDNELDMATEALCPQSLPHVS